MFYQPTSSSNVFMYDETFGSLDLGTQSHGLTVIIDSLNRMMKKADLFQAGDPHWVFRGRRTRERSSNRPRCCYY